MRVGRRGPGEIPFRRGGCAGAKEPGLSALTSTAPMFRYAGFTPVKIKAGRPAKSGALDGSQLIQVCF